MAHFRKFWIRDYGHMMPDGSSFRGRNFTPDPRTLTVPDVVPTLKEIVLSGSATLVGQPLYDNTIEEGVRRMMIQNAPLEAILNARFSDFEEVTADVEPSHTAQKDKETPENETKPE